MKKNGIEFKVGTKFRGNVNGAEFEVVKIEKENAFVKVTKCDNKQANGKIDLYSLKHLQQLLVTEI